MAQVTTHGDIIEAVRKLIGRRVLVQMRSGVAGDWLTIEDELLRLKPIEEEGTLLVLGSGRAVLHLHPLGSAPTVDRIL